MSAQLVVATPGGASAIQDLGRSGLQRYGVSQSGAMDRLALRIANLLVGNDESEACIEFALVGGEYEAVGGACLIAVAGGDFPVSVDGTALSAYRSCDLRDGSRLSIGRSRFGVYGYLAVYGGFDVAPILGSRSTHLRSGIGGGLLTRGAWLGLRRAQAVAGRHRLLAPASWPRHDGPIRVIMGPQDDLFTPKGCADFLAGDYRVTGRSDRMGYHLHGATIEPVGGFDIVSDGIAFGSIQVPGTGQPIVLLADRQSTGGYPKIATIISADIRRLAQRRVQDLLRFVAVPPDDAETIASAPAAELARLRASIGEAARPDLFSSERLLATNLVDGVVAPGEAPIPDRADTAGERATPLRSD